MQKISATHFCGVCTTVSHNPYCCFLLLHKEISPITTTLLLGKGRTQWGEHQLAIRCYIPKALSLKYQITVHRLGM